MIRFALRCANEHDFEAWFRSGDDYDRSAAQNEVACPVCGEVRVEKALMAPALGGSNAVSKTDDQKVQLAAADPREKALRSALRELREKIVERADYVGDKFADEARKIHYEEVEPRGIYGEASSEEAKALNDEGIEFHPLPPLPEDNN
ncbi:MAG: DUF1178 family protein [Hyphomicrobiales bacterium]|nr:DUF1178 family protein [Hyphomicrobiales bacterium]